MKKKVRRKMWRMKEEMKIPTEEDDEDDGDNKTRRRRKIYEREE